MLIDAKRQLSFSADGNVRHGLAALTAALLLSSCGGGSGGGTTATPGGGSATAPVPECQAFIDSFNNQVSCAQMAALPVADISNAGGGDSGDAGGDGSAGDGAAIANTKLQFKDINGRTIETTTDANGYYRINLRGMKAPIVAFVVRDNLPWTSMLVETIVPAPANRKFYTINLTALTQKIASDVAVAAGLKGPAQLTPVAVQNNIAQVQVAKDALNAQLAEKLVEAGLDPKTFNPLTQAFKPDLTGYDKVLESVAVIQNPGGTTELQPKYSIGGSISGSRAGLVLKNGSDSLSVANDATTTFAMPVQLLPGAAYNVEIATQPSAATCAVSNASGTMGKANVTNISISCSATTYSLGGTVTGMGSASGLVLSSNGQTVSLPANSSGFAFAKGLPAGTAYSVSVQTQPTGATCSVGGGASGSMPASNVTSVAVNCSTTSARLGGSISGLSANGLQLSAAGQSISVATGATNFSFASPVAFGAAYIVTVGAQPGGQTCTVSNGSGSMGATDINTIAVSCSTHSASLGGVVKNLEGSGLVLRSNGQSVTVAPSLLTITPKPDVSFNFATPLLGGTAYDVSVQTQPSGQTCTVGSGSGSMAGVNVTSVVVTCASTPLYTLGGTANGNTSALVLSAGAQTVTVPAIQCVTAPCVSNFTFDTALAAGTAYNVTVQTQPTGQVCTVSNGSGTMPAASVKNVTVDCSAQPATVNLTGTWSGTYSWNCGETRFGSTAIIFNLVQTSSSLNGSATYLGSSSTSTNASISDRNFYFAVAFSTAHVNNVFTGTLASSGNQISGTTLNGDSAGTPTLPRGCSAPSGPSGTFDVSRQ